MVLLCAGAALLQLAAGLPADRYSGTGSSTDYAIVASSTNAGLTGDVAGWRSTGGHPELGEPNATSSPPSLARHPYVQSCGQTSAVIAWKTDVAVTGAVEYGTTTALGLEASDTGTSTDHAVTLAGLLSGTTYYYTVKGDGVALATESFDTNKAGGPFTFVVFGDSGGGAPAQIDLAPLMDAEDPDFALHVGDVIYPDGEPENYDPYFFDVYRDLIKNACLFPTLGNHDIRTGNGQPYLDAFHLPTNAATGSERFYSFEYGDALFLALDTNSDFTDGSVQNQWLDQQLASTTRKWKFVYFHHAPFSIGNHGDDDSVIAELVPVFEQRGVDVVFAGHDHLYMRSVPINRVQYIVTGAGGRSLYVAFPRWYTAAYLDSTYSCTAVAVDGDTLTIRQVKQGGQTFDTFVLEKKEVATIELTPTDDSFVWGGAANANFGTSTVLEVDLTDQGFESQSYLKFDVSGLAGEVQAAWLRLYVDNPSVSGGSIHSITDLGWSESTITWNSRPQIDGTKLSTLATVFGSEWIAFDVGQAISGDGTYSFAINSTSTNGVSFSSKETPTNQPVLEIDYMLPAASTNTPPVADPGGPYVGVVGEETAFDGSGSSDPDGDAPLTFEWDFGDESSASAATTTHAYLLAGQYTVTLVVSDGVASSTPATTTATVSNPPPPPTPVPPPPTPVPAVPWTGLAVMAVLMSALRAWESRPR